jgi:hypothetical protein
MTRMREFLRLARRLGWRAERTGRDHYRLTHPDARRAVYTGSTPSCRRAWRNALAAMRRALRGREDRP